MATENENNDTAGESTDGDDETKETLFDAVSDAIDAETVDLDSSDADGDAPTGEKDETDSEVENDEEKDSKNKGDDDKLKADESADGEGDTETPEGDDKTVPGSDAPGDEKPEGSEKPDGDVPDHVNDPISEELKEGTKERIRWLANRVKEVETSATKSGDDLDDMITMVQDAGATGEQYGQMLTFLSLFNSEKIEDKRNAFEIMQKTLNGLAATLGEPVAGADPLEGHADLQQELEAGTITAARATEVAQSRAREAAAAAHTTATSEMTASESERMAAIEKGKAELVAFETATRAIDKRWVEKKAILVPALKAMMRMMPPAQWKTTFETAYKELKLPDVVAPKPKPKTPTPLRPKAPAGEGEKEPTTMGEAIELSLGGSLD